MKPARWTSVSLHWKWWLLHKHGPDVTDPTMPWDPTHFGLFAVRWLVAFFFCSKNQSLHGDFQSIYSATFVPYSEKLPPIKYRVYKQLQRPWPFKLRYSLRYKWSWLKSFLKIKMSRRVQSSFQQSKIMNGRKKAVCSQCWGAATGNCFIFS